MAVTLKAPRVRAGQPITAAWANSVADAVNGVTQAPKLLVEGVPEEVAATVQSDEEEIAVARTTRTTRFTNPDDETLYVDVIEPVQIVFRRSDGTLVRRSYE